MNIIPYGRQTIENDDINAVTRVLKSDFMTQGPEIVDFERVIADHHNAKFAVAFSSGTAALHAAYTALGISSGDEIVTSPITFAATSNAAVYCGGVPEFTDIDIETNCINIDKLEEKISRKTKVVSPVAYAGYPVDLSKISKFAKDKGCKVLYDAAHAIGSRRDGTFGMEYVDAAILSFHPVKHIAAGEGGMVLTNDENVYKSLVAFRSHGITKDPNLLEKSDGPWYYEMHSLGYNYRITDIQCALANSQFKRIDDNLRRRNEIARWYGEALEDVSWIKLPPGVGYEILECDRIESVENLHSYHLYTISLPDPDIRRKFYEYMHENGILVQIHYIPVHLQPFYRSNYGFKEGDFPESEAFYQREVSIPMFHGLKDEEIEYIIEKIKDFQC